MISHQEQYRRRKEKLSQKSPEEIIKIKKEIAEKRSLYYQRNKETIKKYRRDYYDQNKETVIKCNLKWRANNKERLRVIHHKKFNTDPQYKIRYVLRNRFRCIVEGRCKTQSALTLLGCSVEEFKNYIENKFKAGMSWENHGGKGWHFDHIKPCSSFDLSDISQQEKCFHYTNFQPLWWYENLSKSDKV